MVCSHQEELLPKSAQNDDCTLTLNLAPCHSKAGMLQFPKREAVNQIGLIRSLSFTFSSIPRRRCGFARRLHRSFLEDGIASVNFQKYATHPTAICVDLTGLMNLFRGRLCGAITMGSAHPLLARSPKVARDTILLPRPCFPPSLLELQRS